MRASRTSTPPSREQEERRRGEGDASRVWSKLGWRSVVVCGGLGVFESLEGSQEATNDLLAPLPPPTTSTRLNSPASAKARLLLLHPTAAPPHESSSRADRWRPPPAPLFSSTSPSGAQTLVGSRWSSFQTSHQSRYPQAQPGPSRGVGGERCDGWTNSGGDEGSPFASQPVYGDHG